MALDLCYYYVVANFWTLFGNDPRVKHWC